MVWSLVKSSCNRKKGLTFESALPTVDNVLSGDQASLFVAFLGRGASRCSLDPSGQRAGSCLPLEVRQKRTFPRRSQRNVTLFR